jgi:hypothetical protein
MPKEERAIRVNPKKAKKPEGAVWVSSTGDIYKESTIDIDVIRKLATSNVYARGLWKKLKNMVFNEPPTIEVFDPEGTADEEMSNLLERMAVEADIWPSMQKAFMDVFFYGASFYNPVWEDKQDGNGIQLTDLRHLPAYSFNNVGNFFINVTTNQMYNGILNGVVYDTDKKTVRYFQTDSFDTYEITNILHVKEPDSDSLAGDPVIYPLVPVIEMLKYAWNSNMQTAQRVGAPVIFIKIINPRPTSNTLGGTSDAEWAQTILKNWGKDTAFTLRDNMELIPLNISEGDVAGRIIDQLEKLLLDHVSPAKFVTKTGTLIGGSTDSEGEMMEAYVRGQHTWLCDAFEELLNQYFTLNGFPDGYYCSIHVPISLPGQTTTNMNQAQIGFSTKTLDTNEIRSLLGFEPLDEESLTKLRDEYASAMPNPFGGSPFGGPEGGATGMEKAATKNDGTKTATELEQMQFGGPGSGWTTEGGHVPTVTGSLAGSEENDKLWANTPLKKHPSVMSDKELNTFIRGLLDKGHENWSKEDFVLHEQAVSESTERVRNRLFGSGKKSKFQHKGDGEYTTLYYRTPVKEQWDQRKAGQLAKTLDDLLQELGDEITNTVEDEKSRPLPSEEREADGLLKGATSRAHRGGPVERMERN